MKKVKNNETPAVRELTEMLNIEEIVVNADAMHCKKGISENLLSYINKTSEITHHILNVTYDGNRFELLTQIAQENLNIFKKVGLSIHKNCLNIKNKQLNLISLTVCSTIGI